MQKSKLIKLLKTLNKEEFDRLSLFLKSPFHNTNPNITKLYGYIKKYQSDLNSPKLERTKVYSKIFPYKNFDANKMRKLMSAFTQCLQHYLVELELERENFQKRKWLVKALGHRNAFDLFEKETKILLGELENLPYRDIHVYEKSLWLKHDYYFHPLTDKHHEPKIGIEDVMDDLDRFFVLAKLQFGSEMKNRERIYSKKYPIRLLEESIEIGDVFNKENPVFLFYKNIFELYDPEKSKSAYENGKQLLTKHLKEISKDDQINILVSLRNYIIQKINSGLVSHFKDLLEIYKLGLELHIIINNNKIKEADFTNIVHAGCMQKEFDWTEKFINDYEKNLDKSVREDAKILALAILYFHSKNYDEAMNKLGQHQFVHPLYQLTTKTFLMRLWFEKFYENNDYYDFLLAQLDAFEKYIRRNTSISTFKKEENLNLILAIKKMANYIYQKKSAKEIIEKMKLFLADEKRIIAIRWIEEKLNQLK